MAGIHGEKKKKRLQMFLDCLAEQLLKDNRLHKAPQNVRQPLHPNLLEFLPESPSAVAKPEITTGELKRPSVRT